MSAPITIGIGLKLYFDPARTLAWTDEIVAIAEASAPVRQRRVRCWIAPSTVMLAPVLDRVADTPIGVAAQNIDVHDRGPYTGEVSGADLAALGCTLVEVGHAERRRLHDEDDQIVTAKTAAALRNGLTPVVCIGEPDRTTTEAAASFCSAQLRAVLAEAPAGHVAVAYEPGWAIGADRPAPAEHVRTVCAALRELFDALGRTGTVVYGGSAAPGTLTELGPSVDGLFLGRFAHDPRAVRAVLAEAEQRLALT